MSIKVEIKVTHDTGEVYVYNYVNTEGMVKCIYKDDAEGNKRLVAQTITINNTLVL